MKPLAIILIIIMCWVIIFAVAERILIRKMMKNSNDSDYEITLKKKSITN